MAAANSQTRGLIGVGKRFVNQIRSDPTKPLSLTIRRAVHQSVYDKNVDDHVRPAFVPDEVTQRQSDHYWAPHPKTGVFGPASGESQDAGSNTSTYAAGESVLEQKTFFRPLEVLDKPIPEN
ncbi:Hydrogen peroxide-induced 1 [Heracleum sosnowskyi]|uniref:Hydrogen peroxide-induced 1 n=1 Tax=Heracleum sosnowskyi TaxID=360622 RepID=A0AAD8J8R7_9APIA|nr:Hydrogen peroxide-induced 1 [Heracleum sosnowskyi]